MAPWHFHPTPALDPLNAGGLNWLANSLGGLISRPIVSLARRARLPLRRFFLVETD